MYFYISLKIISCFLFVLIYFCFVCYHDLSFIGSFFCTNSQIFLKRCIAFALLIFTYTNMHAQEFRRRLKWKRLHGIEKTYAKWSKNYFRECFNQCPKALADSRRSHFSFSTIPDEEKGGLTEPATWRCFMPAMNQPFLELFRRWGICLFWAKKALCRCYSCSLAFTPLEFELIKFQIVFEKRC